jgi:hypothetical protein
VVPEPGPACDCGPEYVLPVTLLTDEALGQLGREPPPPEAAAVVAALPTVVLAAAGDCVDVAVPLLELHPASEAAAMATTAGLVIQCHLLRLAPS